MLDLELLDNLKEQASDRAARNGHTLGVFRAARRDPYRYVAFCSHCKQMVIVDAEPAPGQRPIRLFGYALHAGCSRRAA